VVYAHKNETIDVITSKRDDVTYVYHYIRARKGAVFQTTQTYVLVQRTGIQRQKLSWLSGVEVR